MEVLKLEFENITPVAAMIGKMEDMKELREERRKILIDMMEEESGEELLEEQ
jgi:hypothetical protein